MPSSVLLINSSYHKNTKERYRVTHNHCPIYLYKSKWLMGQGILGHPVCLLCAKICWWELFSLNLMSIIWEDMPRRTRCCICEGRRRMWLRDLNSFFFGKFLGAKRPAPLSLIRLSVSQSVWYYGKLFMDEIVQQRWGRRKNSGTFGWCPPQSSPPLPLPSCGQTTTFLWKHFFCLESPDTEK